MSLWDDPVFKSAYNCLSIDDRLKYQKIGEQMYNNDIDYCDPKVTEYNYAKKIQLMLRDGLSIDDMTLDEKRIYLEAFGMDALNEYLKPEADRKPMKRERRAAFGMDAQDPESARYPNKRKARIVGGKRV